MRNVSNVHRLHPEIKNKKTHSWGLRFVRDTGKAKLGNEPASQCRALYRNGINIAYGTVCQYRKSHRTRIGIGHDASTGHCVGKG
eukprot:1347146-Rhodomonas_salina.3